MFESGYFVTAELKVKDKNRISEAKSALKMLAEKTIKEPGCSLFTVHYCSTNEDRFVLWERFDDEVAFREHFEEPHTKDYLELDLTEVVQYFQTNILNEDM